MELNRMHSMSRSFDRLLADVQSRTFGIVSEIHGREDLEAFASAFGMADVRQEVEDLQAFDSKGKYAVEPKLDCFRNPCGTETVPVYVHGRAYGRFLSAFKWCLREENWTEVSKTPPLMRVYVEAVNVSPRHWKALAVWNAEAFKVKGFNPSGMASAFFALRQKSTAELLDERQADARLEIWQKRIGQLEEDELDVLEALGKCQNDLKYGLEYEDGFVRAVRLKGVSGRDCRDAFSSLTMKGFLAQSHSDGSPALFLTERGTAAAGLLIAWKEGRKNEAV